MGDLAELGERQKDIQGMRPWFLEQAHRHNSAITQLFLGPFSKPAILLSDYREVNDILSHRDAVDFKRGKKVDVFSGLLPHAHPAMETFDPRFRESRDLVRDLMAPTFLNNVRAQRISPNPSRNPMLILDRMIGECTSYLRGGLQLAGAMATQIPIRQRTPLRRRE
jgi:hypothetical protein